MAQLEVIISHHDRCVLRFGDTFLKVESDLAKATREHDVLASAPVPVPEVLWWRPGHPSLLALLRLRGEALSATSSPDAWRAAGSATRSIHAAPVPEWTPWLQPGLVRKWLDDDRDFLLDRGLVDRHVVEACHALAADTLTRRRSPAVLTHRDLQPQHVFVEDDLVVGVIDWGDVGVGDPLYDVAVLTVRHPERLDDVERGYGDVDRAVVRAWWAERALGEVPWLVNRGFDPTESIALIRSLV